MKTAKDIIKDLPLNMNDVARLVLEATEELGERGAVLTRLEMLHLLRRVIREGAAVLRSEECTVSFADAAWASVEARADRRATTLRDSPIGSRMSAATPLRVIMQHISVIWERCSWKWGTAAQICCVRAI